ncbi:RsmG family class I SAM-dependent methyltransferase [Gracilimonas sp.]|uniref:RsmG family class I SAM-dependent methyltransferase n=1 Tax=Gracilimonas sp. TaxID=1974203 RepID=UPI00374FE895
MLLKYIDQLLWWNKRVNLVSRDVSRETVRHHVEHSLVISQSNLFQNSTKIIDAGAGGGLPGIPLGIVYPQKEILLNDIVTKKMLACKQMILKLGVSNVSTLSGSVEEADISKEHLIISKHAFKVNDLVALLDGKNWQHIVLLKGEKKVLRELQGIDVPLNIHVFSLEAFGNSFYDGKALVEITRI